MKKKVTIIILFVVFLPCLLQAQDSTLLRLPLAWTLEECIAYAKKNNIQINTLRLNTSSAEEDVKQSRASVLPDLSGTVSQNLINRKNANVIVGGSQTQPDFSSSYGLNSSITLYNGGSLKNDIKAKELTLQSANLSVQQTENDITLSITQAYLNILLARETITYLKEVLATSQVQLKQGQQRFDAGSLARKDLAQLEAQTASDQYNLVNENNVYSLNVVALKQILQLPSSFTFNINIPDTIIVQQAIAPLDVSQAAAQNTRPEVKNGEIGVHIAQTELEIARAGIRPSVSIGAGLATGYSNGDKLQVYSPVE